MAKRPKRFTSRSARFALCLGSITVAFLLAEIALAFLGIPAPEEVYLPKDGSIDWDCYCSNPRGYFVERRLADGRIVYCADHSQDPPRVVDLADPKFSDCIKILTVGDSFTWGFGVRYLDAYPHLLGKILSEDFNQKVVVSNHAHVGRMVKEVEEEMRQGAASVSPDLCIYGYVLNDPLYRGPDRTFLVGPAEKARGMDNADIFDGINQRTANLLEYRNESLGGTVRKYSRVVELGLRAWEWSLIANQTIASYHELYDEVKNREGLRITWDAIANMRDMQKEAGKRFLVVVFPLFVQLEAGYPFRSIHEKLARQFQAMNVDSFDLLPVFEGSRTADLCVHPLDRHPNERAHRIAAEAISRFILERDLLQSTDSKPGRTAPPRE